MNRKRMWFHQGTSQSFRCSITVVFVVPSDVRAMEPWKSALPPERQMENRDIAVTDQGLGVAPSCRKIQCVSDAIRSFATSSRKDRPNSRILQGIIHVGKAVFIAASQIVTVLVKRVLAYFDTKPPACQEFGSSCNLLSIRRTCRRHEPHTIAGSQAMKFHRGFGTKTILGSEGPAEKVTLFTFPLANSNSRKKSADIPSG